MDGETAIRDPLYVFAVSTLPGSDDDRRSISLVNGFLAGFLKGLKKIIIAC